jgi:23S rRNA (guanosine2251-2'-O)-methyltransferase
VVNLSRALEIIAEAGYWRIALDGAGSGTLAEMLPAGAIALVLGAEGEGLRPNVAQHCDAVARLPISAAMESLNVSNAAAVALYAVACRAEPD